MQHDPGFHNTPTHTQCLKHKRTRTQSHQQIQTKRHTNKPKDNFQVSVNLCNGGQGCCGSGMHTPGPNGQYLGTDGKKTKAQHSSRMKLIFFIFWLSFSPSFQYLGDHEYTIFDPKSDTAESWQYWDLICKVLFLAKFLLKKENDCHFPLRHLYQQEREANWSPLGQERNLIAFFSSSTTSLTSQPSRSQSYHKGRVPRNMQKKLRHFPLGARPLM